MPVLFSSCLLPIFCSQSIFSDARFSLGAVYLRFFRSSLIFLRYHFSFQLFASIFYSQSIFLRCHFSFLRLLASHFRPIPTQCLRLPSCKVRKPFLAFTAFCYIDPVRPPLSAVLADRYVPLWGEKDCAADKSRLTLVMSLYLTRFTGGKPPSSSYSCELSRFLARRERKFQEECFFTSKQPNRKSWGLFSVFLWNCFNLFLLGLRQVQLFSLWPF